MCTAELVHDRISACTNEECKCPALKMSRQSLVNIPNEECKCPALKVSQQSLVNVPMRSASALQDPLPSFVALGTHA